MSGVTDPYQPIERQARITRRCLEVLVEFRQPVIIITKNHLVTRDIDLFQELARFNAVRINLSITSLNGDLARVLEPRASQPFTYFLRSGAEAHMCSCDRRSMIDRLRDHIGAQRRKKPINRT